MARKDVARNRLPEVQEAEIAAETEDATEAGVDEGNAAAALAKEEPDIEGAEDGEAGEEESKESGDDVHMMDGLYFFVSRSKIALTLVARA